MRTGADGCEDHDASLKGQYRLHDFFTDDALETLAAGRTLAVNDIASDPCTRARHSHYAALDIGALVNTPYVRDGEWRGSLTVHRRAPSIWLTDEIELMRDLSSRVWASIERSRVTASVRESEAALRHASRLKDEFLATLSHELRTPLNAVLGWAHLLRTTTLPPDVTTRGFEALERNARVQGQLVDDLLDMSRIVAGKLQIDHEAVELPTVLASAVETVAPTAAAKGVSLVVTGTDGPCHVSGDADRIRQILWNLVSNAIKFTPPGGTVDISLTKVGGYIDVTVRDTGEGIDPSFLPQMFERFRQADATTTRRHGGLGRTGCRSFIRCEVPRGPTPVCRRLPSRHLRDPLTVSVRCGQATSTMSRSQSSLTISCMSSAPPWAARLAPVCDFDLH